jgi:hypothetical protein
MGKLQKAFGHGKGNHLLEPDQALIGQKLRLLGRFLP